MPGWVVVLEALENEAAYSPTAPFCSTTNYTINSPDFYLFKTMSPE